MMISAFFRCSGNLLHSSPFFRFYKFTYFRHFANVARHHQLLECDDDTQLFLNSIRNEFRLGFSNVDRPISIFYQLNSINPRPCVIVFNQLFTAMSKIKPHPPFQTIISFSHRLESSGICPDKHSFGILANCYCHLGRVDFAFSLLGKRLKLGYFTNAVILNTLINGLIHSHNVPQAVQLDKIVKFGFQPDLFTFGAMFKGLSRIGDNAGALRLLRNMESSAACKPDVVIYSTIIDSLCKDQLLPQALHLFKVMKTKGIWSEMLESNIVPDVKTYSMLIDMYCKEGKVNQARDVLDSMTKNGVSPDIISYSTLLDGYSLRGQMQEAEKLMDLMLKNGCEPDIVTFNSLIHGYCKQKKVDHALEIFKACILEE